MIITKGVEGRDENNEDRKATTSSGKDLEESANRALMRQGGEKEEQEEQKEGIDLGGRASCGPRDAEQRAQKAVNLISFIAGGALFN